MQTMQAGSVFLREQGKESDGAVTQTKVFSAIMKQERKGEEPVRILLVEDEAAIAQPLQKLLERQGWLVTAAATVAGARKAMERESFDAALVDLGLPDGSGEEVCCALRGRGDAAILILTARADEGSVVRALEGGADDYIIKPFRAGELISRVKAVLRRRKGPELLCFGGLTVDRRSARVFVGEAQIPLTAQEYRLLLVFLSNPGQILERGQLLQALWDQEGNFVNDNTLTVTVKRLREKLAEGCGWHIATVRGLGYRWEEEPDA